MSKKRSEKVKQVPKKVPDSNQDGSAHKLEESFATKTKLYLMGIPFPEKSVASILMSELGQVVFLTSDDKPADISTVRINRWSQNSSKLLSALKESISCLPLVSGVAQMRITIGSFIFDQYRKPRNLQDGYSFDEFDQMLSHEISKGHITPGPKFDKSLLLDRISKASELFSTESDQNFDPSVRRSVKVEFPAKRNMSVHLEVDFKKAGERYERFSSRWIESQVIRQSTESKPVLQAVMLNPDRADWELKIRGKSILVPDQLSNSMRELQNEIRFGDNIVDESLLAQPRRHTVISSKYSVFRLSEKFALHFPIKGTDYILEIARYDIYYPKKQTRSAASSPCLDFKPPSTFWEALIFGRSWDQDMENISGFMRNQNIDPDKIIDSLFKRRADETQEAAIERFIMAVTNVAGLWNDASSDHKNLIYLPPSQPRQRINPTRSVSEGILIDLD